MTLQVTAHAYHLRYVTEEDRIVVAVDISPEHELAMPMTRRLTRNLLGAMAKMASDKGQASVPAGTPPLVRDTILDFEHSQSVAAAVAEGHMRNETPREKPPTMPMPMRLVHEVKLVPRNNGGIALVFENGEQQLILEIAPERIHMVIETFVQMAERAGWDFPPMASWLDPAKTAVASAPGKSLN